uniref:Uncharacterized protein n=1 Tax=Plectus sambesii TaxID=2011161 RepID=A0A914WI04_9BILA
MSETAASIVADTPIYQSYVVVGSAVMIVNVLVAVTFLSKSDLAVRNYMLIILAISTVIYGLRIFLQGSSRLQ